MSREAQFVLAAVRRFLHPQMSVPEPDTTGLDWSETLRLASVHAVVPMLYRAPRAQQMLDDGSEKLRTIVRSEARCSLALGAELCRLAELFERNAIGFVPLKGPLLSQQLYGDMSVRSSGDLDLLVHPSDVLRVRDVLRTAGYRVGSPQHWPCDSASLRCRECEMVLIDAPRSLSVDVHWRILPSYFASPFDHAAIWESLSRVRFADRDIPCMSPEHVLLLLCAHGSKHAFERLGWICDIARCIIAFPRLRWPAVLAASARAGTTRQLLLGLRVAADLLSAPLPSMLPIDPAVEPLARRVRERLLAARFSGAPETELIPFCLRAFESTRHRLRYLLGHLSPSWAEYKALALPPSLYWVYYPFRPLRLITRYANR
jgi:hypothetical protein